MADVKIPNSAFADVDILIVGAGLVGGVAATALAASGFSVAAIDGQAPATVMAAGFDGRASAIAQASRRLLGAVGIWPHLEPLAAPIKDIRVADGRSPLYLHYDHMDLGQGPLGFMLENRHIHQGIHAAIQGQGRLQLIAPMRLDTLRRDGAGADATLADGRRIRARLAIAADGRMSQTRQDAKLRTSGWRYRQMGIVCTVEHQWPHDFVAHEHFLPAGPFAILPLIGTPERPACRSSIVWAERAEHAPAMVGLDDETFLIELAKRFGDFLGDLTVIGPRFCHPLGLQFSETAVAERLVLIGDADHGMHPLAGQGLNMGLRDVAALVDVLTDARRLGLDIGQASVLDRYRRWRGFDNTLMLAATDGLNRLFSNDLAPLRFVRDLGLAAVDRLPPLKKYLMRSAMGLAGELPSLMRR
ncbi:MAG: UbiH/UbiF/VisC/COQ6 family ubiquinone biosynthesis hydroxylase [Proteobacteria bacterium]|nr:UbiH/UbiF/VisC/COQ6 family ubiquinone biosynthesis hydroxylase [Pseudomonadota bacterium]